MFPSQKERGLRVPIIRRFGLKGFPAWRGLNKQNDRGALNPVQFWELVNVRNSGGSWDVRGGVSAAVNTNAFTGCVEGIVDLPGTTAGILINGSAPSLNSYGPDLLTLYDPNDPSSATYLTALNMSSFILQANLPSPRRPMCIYDSKIYFADSSNGISVLSLATSPGQSLTDSRAVTQVALVPYAINYLVSAFNLLWITTSSGYVYTWDGTTLTEVGSGFSATPAVIAQYQETMYLCGTDYLSRLNSDGTWTSISLPAHANPFEPRCIAWCQDVNKLYFGGRYYTVSVQNDPVLFEYNGTAVTESFTYADVVQTTEFFDGVTDVVEWAGVATFIWHQWGIDLTGAVYIGTVADPTAVPIGDTQTTNAANTCLFVDSNDMLYAGINAEWDAPASPNRVIRRDGSSLGGYWHTDADKSGWTAIGIDSSWGVGGTDNPPAQLLSQI